MFFDLGAGLMGLAVVPHVSDCPGDKFILGCRRSSVLQVRVRPVLTSDDLQPAQPQLTDKPCPEGCKLDSAPPPLGPRPQLSFAFHGEVTFLSSFFFLAHTIVVTPPGDLSASDFWI